ncbi:NUDIX domain-containing protein [Mycoplasmopsis ciconiae]|uniref:NUDIX domain-containing protein n=1 Tax=Mycoplasmopsis ciconiae TaxID=561067 RepID=A0ABU7MLJ9_9BACT|nr:NUDIX domain-containing protein [Mycoplasmopsis ciconiae]
MKPDKLLFQTKWLSLYETNKGFIYAERKGVDSIAFLAFKKENGEYLFHLRYQLYPNLKHLNNEYKFYPSCITGTIEANETPIQTVIKEAFEEGGFKISQQNIISYTPYLATTQSNEIVHVYLGLIDSSVECCEAQGDGSYFEKISFNKWVNIQELQQILKNEITHSSLFVAYKLFLEYINKANQQKN